MTPKCEKNKNVLTKGAEKAFESRDGVVVIAIASCQCGPCSSPESWACVLLARCWFFTVLQEVFLWLFSVLPLSSKTNIFVNSNSIDLPENHCQVSGASWVNIICYY